MHEMTTHQPKKSWAAPRLASYGTVEELTLKTVIKSLGAGDDFASTIQTIGPPLS